QDYFPTFFSDTLADGSPRLKRTRTNTDNFKFKVRVKDIAPVAIFLNLPLKVSSNTIIQGSFDAQKNSLEASGLSDLVEYNKMPIREWFLAVNTSNKQMQVTTGFKRIDLGDS